MYEALGVAQGGVLSLVAQEVAQLGGGQDAGVAGVVDEDVVQLRPPQELPAELLDLHGVQAIVSSFVTPLRRSGGEPSNTPRETNKYIQEGFFFFLNQGALSNANASQL